MRPRSPRSALAPSSASSGSSSALTRLLAFAAGQTALVALLGGLLGLLTDTAPLLVTGSAVHVRASGPAGAATARALQGLLVVAVALPVVVPVAVGGSRARRGEGHRLVPVGRAVVAVAGLPAALAALWLAVIARAWLAALVPVAAWLALVVGVRRLAARRGPSGDDPGASDADGRRPADARPPNGDADSPAAAVTTAADAPASADARRPSEDAPPTAVLGVAAGVVLLAGVVAVPAVAPGQTGVLVESERVYTPYVEWAFDYEPVGDGRGVLTITHDGGDAVAADRLTVAGTGFADVPGANQTAPGRWRGTREPGGSVLARDGVTVGVRSDCDLRIVFADLVAIGEYTCPGGR